MTSIKDYSSAKGSFLKMCIKPYMARDRGISFAQVLLQTDIGQCVLPKDRLGIQVGSHESTLSRKSLKDRVDEEDFVFSLIRLYLITIRYVMNLGGCKTFHVGGLKEAGQVICQVRHSCVHRHLVFPLKLRPHRPELGLGA